MGAAGVGGGGGSFDATADGAITAGDAITLNSNGTVSSITVEDVLSSLSATYTSQTSTYYTRIAWMAGDQRVCVFYRDGSNNYLMGVIGEVTGGTISWNSPVTITTRNAYLSSVSPENTSPNNRGAQSMVVCYRDASNGQACAQVVQLSTPSSFSVGGAVELNSGDQPVAAYNYNYGVHVVVYRNSADNYTAYYTNVTRSGTSLSQGSGNAQVYSNQITTLDICTCSDASVCAVMSDRTTSTRKVLALTLTPTSSNFCNYSSDTVLGSGTGSSWDVQQGLQIASESLSSGTSRMMVVAPAYSGPARVIPFFVTNSGTFNIGTAYQYKSFGYGEADIAWGDSLGGFAVIDEGSLWTFTSPAYGSSPSVSLKTSYGNTSVGSQYVAIHNAYDYGVFRGLNFVGSNEKGKYLESSTNSANYIGFAGENISSGQSGKILTLGSVSEDQTGLTVNARYYLKDDGTIDTTQVSGREVGKAVASTKLIITTTGIS